MNNEIKSDIFKEKYIKTLNEIINDVILNNPDLIKKNSILEIEYNMDGTKKDIYSLASERDVKNMQIKSDKDVQDFNFSQNKITKDEYEYNIELIDKKKKDMNLLYDDLIFSIIDNNSLNDIENSIIKYNLNNIDLSRLADAISSVAENKIEEFRKNNKNFMLDKLSYWNYKYDKISKSISKCRELESFLINIIGK